jgi:hypothetical protein
MNIENGVMVVGGGRSRQNPHKTTKQLSSTNLIFFHTWNTRVAALSHLLDLLPYRSHLLAHPPSALSRYFVFCFVQKLLFLPTMYDTLCVCVLRWLLSSLLCVWGGGTKSKQQM